MSTNLGFENTDSILIEDRIFVPAPEVVDNANITAYMESKGFDNYEDFYRWSLAHRNEFWENMAKELHWFEPWQTTFAWTDKPFFNWFAGGKFNIVYNCLDRYMQTPTRSKVAYYWEGDGGATRTISYEDLYLMTNRIAKGLQNLGVKKGDRVAIYMPMIPELIAAALAVARLGAAHMVVFGGFAASALRDRIIDCEAKVLITADGGFRGGKVIELKHIADEAIAETPAIQKAVVVRHTGMEVPMKAGRDIYMDELLADIPEATVVPCEPMDSEDLPAKHDLSRLRLLGTVGEPINPEAWMWYRKNIGRNELPIMDTWWQTETGMILISPTPILPLKPGSASRPLPTIEADVVDKNGNSVPPGKGGFLIIRHPWPAQMRTIFGDPARYQTYWDTIEGVYFAGDAAHMDDDGYIRIQGRVDDVIKVSGHRLGSMEIESSLVSHPAVAEAAAIGKPDEIKGEHVKVFIILKQGIEPSDNLAQELKQHVRTVVGPLATPDELEFVPSLPKTRSGKIMRRGGRSRVLGEQIGDISTLEV